MKKIITDSEIKHTNGRGQVALLLEPYLLHPEDYIEAAGKDFDMVLSHHKRFVNIYDNWKYYPLGGTFIQEEDRKIWEKKGGVSMFISKKDTMPGHLLRKKVLQNVGSGIDFFGDGVNNHVENKADGLRDYPFSIVIESCQERGYFTEKIIDCFLTGTIPIYWGDPDIGDYFNTSGIFVWEKPVDLAINIMDLLHGWEGYYRAMEPAMRANFEIAKEFISYGKQIQYLYPEIFE